MRITRLAETVRAMLRRPAAPAEPADAATTVDSSGWRRRGPSIFGLWDPAAFSEADVRAFWRFRARFVDLQPSVDPDDDYRAFADFVRRADDAWVWLAADGALLGTCFHRHERVEIGGRARVVVYSEYGYTAVRGHPAVVLGQASAYLRVALAQRQAIYFGGFAYPHGYLSYATTLPHVWLLGAPGIPDEARALAELLARRWGGDAWDPVGRRVRFRTLPREPVRAHSRERAALLAGYEAQNPEWRAGVGLFLFARVGSADLAAILRRALARALRSRRR